MVVLQLGYTCRGSGYPPYVVLCCVLQFMVNRYLALLRESDILNKLRCAAQQIHHSYTCKHL